MRFDDSSDSTLDPWISIYFDDSSDFIVDSNAEYLLDDSSDFIVDSNAEYLLDPKEAESEDESFSRLFMMNYGGLIAMFVLGLFIGIVIGSKFF